MKKEMKMPRLRPEMQSGVLCAWLKEEGEPFEAGDVLFEIETDKVVSQIEAPAALRIVSLKAEEGDAVEVGDTVLETEEIAP